MKQRDKFPVLPLTEESVPSAALLCKKYFSHPLSEAALLRAVSSPHCVSLVCMDGNAVIALIHCGYVLDEMSLDTLVVDDGYRRQGIASRLWETAERKVRGICRICYLEVRESNTAARRLYETLGFVQNGSRRRYYTDPEEAAILMSKLLPESQTAQGV